VTGVLAEQPWYYLGQRDFSILIPFGLYMLGVAVITVLSYRHRRGEDFGTEYYVAGRSFGAWVLAMSWVATLASGGTFLGYPSLVYSYGWSMAFWVSGSTVTAVVGLGIVGKRINRLARRTGALTLVDLLRDRFSSHSVGVIYTLVIMVTTSVYLIAQFVAGARILENLLVTSYPMGLALFAVSVVAYTTYGGFRAVAWTDTLQGVVMIIGVVLIVPLALSAVGGLERATLTGDRPLATRVDPEAAAHGEPTDRHAYLYPPGPRKITDSGDNKMGGVFLPAGIGLSLFLIRSLGVLMMPTTVPRMLAFRDTVALRRALLLLAPYFLLMYGSSLISMNCAHSLGLDLPAGKSDQAMPALAMRLVELQAAPALLAGLLIAAPFAAVMSTVDSALLVISASVVRDLVEKSTTIQLSETGMRRLSYSVTALSGTAVFFGALLIEPAFLQPLVIHYVAASASALFWPGLATLFWRRATAAGVTAGLAGGGLVYVVAIFYRPLDPLIVLHPFVYGFLASVLLVAVVSFRTTAQDPEQLVPYFGRE
jgi:SSS family transporter